MHAALRKRENDMKWKEENATWTLSKKKKEMDPSVKEACFVSSLGAYIGVLCRIWMYMQKASRHGQSWCGDVRIGFAGERMAEECRAVVPLHV